MDDLIEAVVSAYRERRRGRVLAAPEWHDLDEADRLVAFDRTLAQRRLEAALDPWGCSSTAAALLGRIRGT